MIRRPPRSTQSRSSAASDVYKRQALELPFVFNHLHAPNTVEFMGNEPPQKLADIMQDTWIAFAKTGDPNHKGMPYWPAYNTQTRATMILNVNPSVENDPVSYTHLR